VRSLVAVNYSYPCSQCDVRAPILELESGQWRLRDLLGEAEYQRDGDKLRSRRLYLDVAPWHTMFLR
jgi:hypothetical protein